MISAEDRVAIRDVLIRYAHAVRTKQFDLLDEVFTPEASVDFTTVGGNKGTWTEVKPWLEGFAGSAHLFHLTIGNEVITAADAAEVWLVTTWSAVYVANEGAGAISSYGSYDDRLVRTAGGWRICRRADCPALMLNLGTHGDTQ